LTVIATLAGTIGTGRLIAWASCTYRKACRRDRPNALVSVNGGQDPRLFDGEGAVLQ
jgi:hypothetical protein